MAEQLNCEAIIDAGLIEQYLAGMLSEAEIEAFESHYLTCDRCQNELRLAATIKDALPELLHEQAVVAGATETDTDRRWLGRRKRIGAVAVAIAAALAGILLIQPADVENLEHREPEGAGEAAVTVEAPVGTVGAVDEFRWTPVAGADLYRITLYDDAGVVIWETETRETRATIPDTLQLRPGGPYLWQLNARVGWDRWLSSDLLRFEISER